MNTNSDANLIILFITVVITGISSNPKLTWTASVSSEFSTSAEEKPLKNVFVLSYVAKCIAVYGTFITSCIKFLPKIHQFLVNLIKYTLKYDFSLKLESPLHTHFAGCKIFAPKQVIKKAHRRPI